MPRRQLLTRRRATVLLGGPLVLVLASCSSPVPVVTADDGGSPACADVLSLLPATLAGAPRRDTSGGPGTAAWGDPAILLRCGVEPVAATTQPCVGVPGSGGEVDWVVLATDDTGSIVRTFGREPAVELEVPAAYGPAPVSVLPDLGEAVSVVEPTAVCVD
ncbi:DUF3515 family protein [Aquipuribacter sp. MA13-6]|uniref:DUF3515 family protein n=1 Tax=unclassified Aquipuribacter TaxID=2635084 RepID=UPI003EEBA8C5